MRARAHARVSVSVCLRVSVCVRARECVCLSVCAMCVRESYMCQWCSVGSNRPHYVLSNVYLRTYMRVHARSRTGARSNVGGLCA